MAQNTRKKGGWLPEGHFRAANLDLPEEYRPRLRVAAARLDLAGIADFCRRAVLEALRRAEAGQPPFPLDSQK